MPLLSFREPNSVLWRGVRPGHNGTQVFAYKTTSGAIEEVYKVTAGKTLFLTTMIICINGSAAGELAWVIVYDSSDTAKNNIFRITLDAVGQLVLPITYNPPYEIPATWYINHRSSAETLDINTAIHGWED